MPCLSVSPRVLGLLPFETLYPIDGKGVTQQGVVEVYTTPWVVVSSKRGKHTLGEVSRAPTSGQPTTARPDTNGLGWGPGLSVGGGGGAGGSARGTPFRAEVW